ncbi:hypothetical protein BGZ47_000231, partial [Haplosporangium gracile]
MATDSQPTKTRVSTTPAEILVPVDIGQGSEDCSTKQRQHSQKKQPQSRSGTATTTHATMPSKLAEGPRDNCNK